MKNENLEPEINQDVEYGFNEPAVKLALRLMSDFAEEKKVRDEKNKVIEKMIDQGFTVSSPDGLIKIHSKTLIQAVLKMVARSKPIDGTFHATGAKKATKKIMSEAVRTIADEGNFDSALRDKMGAYWTSFFYGDAFTGMWSNPNENSLVPFVFSSLDNSNVYVNKNAIKMRASYGKSVTQLFLVVPMRWDEAIKLYPDMAKRGTSGRFPTESDVMSDTFSLDTQEVHDDDITEIGYLFDIINGNYSIIGGAGMTLLEEYEDYPFVDENNENYIPVMHHICIPSTKGFYNWGFGDILYELAIITQQLLNMGTVGALEEALPFDMINIPKTKAKSFLNQMLGADTKRKEGKRPYLVNEYDPNNPQQISVQTLQSQYGTRWAELMNMLNRELLRFGINLDEAAYQQNATATEVMAVEQSQVTFVKQYMETNASEYQFFYGMIMSMICNYIPTTNKKQINLTTTVYDENGRPIEIDGITYGMVSKELKERDWFVRVNSRTGVIPSGVMEMNAVMQQLQTTPQGTPAFFKALQSLYGMYNRDVSFEDLGFGQAPAGAGEVPQNATPSQTDRLAINVRNKEQTASI